MKRAEQVIILVSAILLLLFLLLVSCHLNRFLTPLTPEQQRIFAFLDGDIVDLGELYTPAEVSHLRDVRWVMGLANGLFALILLGGLGVACFVHHQKLDVQRLWWYASLSSLVVLGVVTVFTIFAFNVSFTVFHLLLFPQGNWTFPADSMLISTFPAEFFIALGIRIMGGALLLSLILFFFAHHLKKSRGAGRG